MTRHQSLFQGCSQTVIKTTSRSLSAKVYQMTRGTVLLTTSLIFSLPLVACNQSKEAQTTNEHKQDTVTPATLNNNDSHNAEHSTTEPPKIAQDTDTTLAQMTLTTALQSVSIPLKETGAVAENKLTCIDNISETFALNEVQAFFADKFTPEELTTLNALYKSDAAISYTNYGRDQHLISTGVVLTNPTQKPNDEVMKQMHTFSKTKLGKKYIKTTKSKGKNSLASIVMPRLTQEIEKCGVELEKNERQQ